MLENNSPILPFVKIRVIRGPKAFLFLRENSCNSWANNLLLLHPNSWAVNSISDNRVDYLLKYYFRYGNSPFAANRLSTISLVHDG